MNKPSLYVGTFWLLMGAIINIFQEDMVSFKIILSLAYFLFVLAWAQLPQKPN
jgi:hypothetical protein